ncbi:unnamed protein product [Ascophyllum nodosum]
MLAWALALIAAIGFLPPSASVTLSETSAGFVTARQALLPTRMLHHQRASTLPWEASARSTIGTRPSRHCRCLRRQLVARPPPWVLAKPSEDLAGRRGRLAGALLRGTGDDESDGPSIGMGSEGLGFGVEGDTSNSSTVDSMEEGEEEVMEVTEEDMMQEWIERGLDPETFDPLALLQMWESEDAKAEGDEEERWGFYGMVGVGGGVDAATVAVTGADPSPRELAERQRQQREREIPKIPELPLTATALEGEGQRSGRAVGIDLGTTNSAVALIVNGKPAMVPNSHGRFTTPSVVSLKNKGKASSTTEGGVRVVIGEAASKRVASQPRSTYSSVKRVIGRTRKEAKEAGVGLGALNVDKSQSLLRLKCPALGEGETVSPEHISAEILKSLIRDVERFLGDGSKVRRAVVAVPAYFNPAQCKATEKAGELAGLEKVKLMKEPEAAALAYGLDKGGDEIILVFDLGGGTFDVSVLEVGGGIAEVIATSGDSQLGGDDFDQAIAEWLSDEVTNAGGGDPRSDPVHTRKLIEAARAARERLTSQSETEVELPLSDGRPSVKRRTSTVTLTRAKMESLIEKPLKRVMKPIREVAIMADVSLPGETGAFLMDDAVYDDDDDNVEARRPPAARQAGFDLDSGVGEEQKQKLRKLRSEQSKARKSARERSKAIRRQVTATAEVSRKMEGNTKLRRFPQGRAVDEVVLVGGATRMPCVQRLVEGITGVKPRRTVDPDKAVALGAAAYAGILEGEVEGQELMTAWQASIYRMMARDRL